MMALGAAVHSDGGEVRIGAETTKKVRTTSSSRTPHLARAFDVALLVRRSRNRVTPTPSVRRASET
jgi:hypothetical protein